MKNISQKVFVAIGVLGLGLFLYQCSTSSPINISEGDRILITEKNGDNKMLAAQAVKQQDTDKAILAFQTILNNNRNDPESLIYLNNLRAKKSSDKTFTIGISVPISTNPNVAQEMLRGVAQAQDEVNLSGGVAGSRLVIAIADDRNDPTIATQVAQAFTKNQSILGVVGHNSSDATLAGAKVYQDQGLVMISPTSTSNKLTRFGSYIFRTIPANQAFAIPLAKYIASTVKKKRVGICQDIRSSDNLSFRDEFVEGIKLEGSEIINLDCEMAAENFDAQKSINSALSERVDALLITPHIDHLEVALRLAEANQGRLPLFSSQTMYTSKVLSGKDSVTGLVMPVFWHKDLNPDFSKNARQYWTGNVSWRTAAAYDATLAIIKGASSSANPTRSSIQSTLRSGQFSITGSTGGFGFDKDTGNRDGKPVLMTIEKSGINYGFAPLPTATQEPSPPQVEKPAR
jgi:branched-chain amino acid transport system substrate-binding protein